ncbi:MAG: hypothetical protein IBX45_11825 [Campylobacterales bacterium]|nr:hypothetical protein [Campylobacterales bacterium]
MSKSNVKRVELVTLQIVEKKSPFYELGGLMSMNTVDVSYTIYLEFEVMEKLYIVLEDVQKGDWKLSEDVCLKNTNGEFILECAGVTLNGKNWERRIKSVLTPFFKSSRYAELKKIKEVCCGAF